MNIFSFTGNLGKDCEVATTQGGMTVCSFSVAVQSGFGDKQKTTWVKCALFGKRAEGALPQYLTTGAKVAISGELTLDRWQNQQGAEQSMLKVAVNTLDLIGGQDKPAQQQRPAAPQSRQAPPQQAPAAPPPPPMDDFDDDLPF